MQIPVRSRSIQELANITTPKPGQLEAVAWTYYDTQPVTTGTTTVCNFFTAVQADRSMGNLEQAGTIQAPNWFELYAIKLDVMDVVTSTAAPGTAGTLTDMTQLLFTQRGYSELVVNSKSYGKVPISFLHPSGGPQGLAQGTPATAAILQYANNGVPDEGYWVGGWMMNDDTGQQEQVGSIILPPTQTFSYQITFFAAPTLTTSPLNLRVTFCGVLHRQVR
jgi:hypothetical protein